MNICTFWCTFYRPKECGGVPKLTNMRYDKIFFPEPQSVGAQILSTSAQFHASLWRGKAYSHSCRCGAMSWDHWSNYIWEYHVFGYQHKKAHIKKICKERYSLRWGTAKEEKFGFFLSNSLSQSNFIYKLVPMYKSITRNCMSFGFYYQRIICRSISESLI